MMADEAELDHPQPYHLSGWRLFDRLLQELAGKRAVTRGQDTGGEVGVIVAMLQVEPDRTDTDGRGASDERGAGPVGKWRHR